MQTRSQTAAMSTDTSTSTTATVTISSNLVPTSSATSSSNSQPPVSIPPQQNANIHTVFARLPMPTVTNTNIEAWFISMEYWFIASGITADRQQFSTVLAAIDPNLLVQLTEILREQPQVGKYLFIKNKLIAHFADSEQRKLNRLLSEMPLGDKRPSELFHEMKRVAGNVLGDAALKGLWLQRLPQAAQPVVAASTGSATEYTKIADSIMDALAPRTVQQVAVNPTSELSELKAMVAEMRLQINSFQQRSRSQSREPTRTRQRTPTNNGNVNTNADPSLCWYHQKFGRDARKCRSPCRNKTKA